MILRLLKHPLLLIATIVIASYFASDLLDAGQTLNASFPGVYMGWAFWGGLMLLLWVIIISPIISFLDLPKWEDVTASSDPEQVKILSAYARKMVKNGERMIKLAKREEDAAKLKQYVELLHYAYIANESVDKKAQHLREAVTNFRKYVKEKELSSVIKKYTTFASLAVVVSRKGFLDSFIIFGLQIKLMIDISRNLGHKPSWAFILCCFIWVTINSLLISLLDEGDILGFIGSSGDELLGELLGVKTAETVVENIPFLRTVGKQLMESAYAGGAVYVTGVLVLNRLMGESKRLTPKELFKLRREGIMLGKVNFKNEA